MAYVSRLMHSFTSTSQKDKGTKPLFGGPGVVNWKWVWIFWIVNGFEIRVGYTMTRGGTPGLIWSWRATVASIRGQRREKKEY